MNSDIWDIIALAMDEYGTTTVLVGDILYGNSEIVDGQA